MKKLFALTMVAILAIGLVPMVSAQEAPAVMASDQVVLNNYVVVDHVVADGPSWIAIHKDDGGSFGPVIGTAHVPAGQVWNLHVHIDAAEATPVLYAMLHVDDGEVGVYEFGTVEGADAPVIVDEAPLAPAFNIELIDAHPQLVDGEFTVANVVSDGPTILVIHDETDGNFGAILGAVFLEGGHASDVSVPLEGTVTSNVWPMLHEDNGAVGEYEGNDVDPPTIIDGAIATAPVSTVETIVAHPQVVIHGENFAGMDMDMDMEGDDMMATSVWVPAVLSDGPGIVVIHADEDGAPGAILGAVFVEAGLTTDLAIEVDEMALTQTVWPMLHDDNGTVGEYEGNDIDNPTVVDGNVVTFPIAIAPSWDAPAQAVSEDGTITIDWALIDDHGWIAIHASVDGAPGPVIGTAPINRGLNQNVVVAIDFAAADGAATDQVFPMLHYDDNAIGTYEFGTVDGADAPVFLDGAPVVGPLGLE